MIVPGISRDDSRGSEPAPKRRDNPGARRYGCPRNDMIRTSECPNRRKGAGTADLFWKESIAGVQVETAAYKNSASKLQTVLSKERKLAQPLHGVARRIEFRDFGGGRSGKEKKLKAVEHALFFGRERLLEIEAGEQLMAPFSATRSKGLCLSEQ